jgi:hypothetical protein
MTNRWGSYPASIVPLHGTCTTRPCQQGRPAGSLHQGTPPTRHHTTHHFSYNQKRMHKIVIEPTVTIRWCLMCSERGCTAGAQCRTHTNRQKLQSRIACCGSPGCAICSCTPGQSLRAGHAGHPRCAFHARCVSFLLVFKRRGLSVENINPRLSALPGR